jgi:hypothetical protein
MASRTGGEQRPEIAPLRRRSARGLRTNCSTTYCSSPVTALVNDFSATISAHSTNVSMTSLVTCSWR